ncbi:MAG: DUF4142 domain-containing protein [Siphonobacter sp.]
MKKVTMLCMMAGAAIAFQACSENKADKAKGEQAEAATDAANEANDSLPTVSETDADFAVKAANGSMLEVELGKLAEQKAFSPKVKEFGARMVKDHGEAGDELKSIASAKGITLPAIMGEEQQKYYDELSKLSGKKFDKKYVSLRMVKIWS